MYKTLPMPHGVFLFTGTGVVPDASFTLHEGDVVTISAGPLGTLVNTIEYVAKG
jgi:2-dehydro-3-deoxy-D-arabinonate dehydratase